MVEVCDGLCRLCEAATSSSLSRIRRMLLLDMLVSEAGPRCDINHCGALSARSSGGRRVEDGGATRNVRVRVCDRQLMCRLILTTGVLCHPVRHSQRHLMVRRSRARFGSVRAARTFSRGLLPSS